MRETRPSNPRNLRLLHLVWEQIRPVVAAKNATLERVDVDEDPELKMEFGDRVPVVLIDDEEFACWDVDNEELAAALER